MQHFSQHGNQALGICGPHTALRMAKIDDTSTVVINKTNQKLEKFKTKEKNKLILENKYRTPTSDNKWMEAEILNIEQEDWANIYTSAFKLTKDT